MSSLPGTNATVSSNNNLIINSTANDVTSCMTSTSQPDQPVQNTQTSGSFVSQRLSVGHYVMQSFQQCMLTLKRRIVTARML